MKLSRRGLFGFALGAAALPLAPEVAKAATRRPALTVNKLPKFTGEYVRWIKTDDSLLCLYDAVFGQRANDTSGSAIIAKRT